MKIEYFEVGCKVCGSNLNYSSLEQKKKLIKNVVLREPQTS